METEDTLARDLVDLMSVMKRITRKVLKAPREGSLTMTQVRILGQVRDGVKQVGKLAEAFGISQPAVSIMVSALVESGFLKRSPHATDRRQIELQLTSKAAKNIKAGYSEAYSEIDKKLASLDPKKRAAVTQQIRELSMLLKDSELETDHE